MSSASLSPRPLVTSRRPPIVALPAEIQPGSEPLKGVTVYPRLTAELRLRFLGRLALAKLGLQGRVVWKPRADSLSVKQTGLDFGGKPLPRVDSFLRGEFIAKDGRRYEISSSLEQTRDQGELYRFSMPAQTVHEWGTREVRATNGQTWEKTVAVNTNPLDFATEAQLLAAAEVKARAAVAFWNPRATDVKFTPPEREQLAPMSLVQEMGFFAAVSFTVDGQRRSLLVRCGFDRGELTAVSMDVPSEANVEYVTYSKQGGWRRAWETGA